VGIRSYRSGGGRAGVDRGLGDVAALFVGLVVVSVWAAGSRLLHWDGLGDTADGVWGGDTPERRLEIMHDSTMGSFGVVAICMTLMAQVLSVSAVFSAGDWWPILAAPVIGRFSACVALWTIDPARPEGLAATLAGGEGMGPWAIAALTVALVFLMDDRSTSGRGSSASCVPCCCRTHCHAR